MKQTLRVVLWAGFGAAGLGFLSAAAMLWSRSVDPVQSVRYARSLSRLVELDAQLNEQVAEAELGFVDHYDDLVRTRDA